MFSSVQVLFKFLNPFGWKLWACKRSNRLGFHIFISNFSAVCKWIINVNFCKVVHLSFILLPVYSPFPPFWTHHRPSTKWKTLGVDWLNLHHVLLDDLRGRLWYSDFTWIEESSKERIVFVWVCVWYCVGVFKTPDVYPDSQIHKYHAIHNYPMCYLKSRTVIQISTFNDPTDSADSFVFIME